MKSPIKEIIDELKKLEVHGAPCESENCDTCNRISELEDQLDVYAEMVREGLA